MAAKRICFQFSHVFWVLNIISHRIYLSPNGCKSRLNNLCHRKLYFKFNLSRNSRIHLGMFLKYLGSFAKGDVVGIKSEIFRENRGENTIQFNACNRYFIFIDSGWLFCIWEIQSIYLFTLGRVAFKHFLFWIWHRWYHIFFCQKLVFSKYFLWP